MVIIPSDQMTLSEKARKREEAVKAAIARGIIKLNCSENELTYRHAQNIADFGTVGREEWLTATLAAINTPYSVWTTLAAPLVGLTPQLANNRLAVFYCVSVLDVPMPVSLLAFRLGVGAGTTKAVFDLQQLIAQVTTEGYFSLPIVYDPQDVLNIVVTSTIATGAQAQVILGCYIVEKVGTTVS